MKTELAKLIKEVGDARNNYLALVKTLNQQQAEWKPSSEVWNVIEVTEHLFWAEQGEIFGMRKIIQAHKEGRIGWEGEAIHKGLPIEEIIIKTWQPKEVVPAVAAPRLGGTIGFWVSSLYSLQGILEDFAQTIDDSALEIMTHPHPISGPMDVRQRLEFLGFHINRHFGQVQQLILEI